MTLRDKKALEKNLAQITRVAYKLQDQSERMLNDLSILIDNLGYIVEDLPVETITKKSKKQEEV